jgi:hypothetical protein
VLRGIDFIFKSPGVNKPLRANEDHPGDNINKTYYRDQINKVANSIKEILDSFADSTEKALFGQAISQLRIKRITSGPNSKNSIPILHP